MLRILAFIVLVVMFSMPAARAAYVSPRMGGAQVTQGLAPMKHADISFDGSRLQVHVDDSVGIPVLRPLEEPDTFDPHAPEGVLGTKAYNFQYGWNAGGFLFVDPGTWIWMEQLDATPGLEVYQRPPASPPYEAIFGTAGSSSRWRWDGRMTHNVYAVEDPQLTEYEATYRVYIGDDVTGSPLPGYESANVVFHFRAIPDLPGDFDENLVYDCLDINQLTAQIASGAVDTAYDVNEDGLVNRADLQSWLEYAGRAADELTDGHAFPVGDANLDGSVDQHDLSIWHTHRFTDQSAWCAGDFNADGSVDGADFNLWLEHRGRHAAAATSAVPEPGGCGLLAAAVSFLLATRHRRATTGTHMSI